VSRVNSQDPFCQDSTKKAELSRAKLQDLQNGMLVNPILLRDGDTLFVPKAEMIFVTGHVRSPGSYVYEPDLTVLQALSLAGGIAERGSSRRVKVVRSVAGQKQEIGVNLDDIVKPGDTIIVQQRFF
jgi:polysaccharide export outer membrane protein